MAANMDLKKKVWSFSSVKSFEQCPYSFYLHYVEGEQELPNSFAQSGSFVHSILERCYKGELYEFELNFSRSTVFLKQSASISCSVFTRSRLNDNVTMLSASILYSSRE